MWTLIARWVVTLVLSYALRPKQQNQQVKRTQLEDIKTPVAEDGKRIPILLGTWDIEVYNTTWYGHLNTVAIRKKGGKK